MTRLSVNLNKVALIRNARGAEINLPDLRRLAEVCVRAGAQGITLHPRPDQRHARVADVIGFSRSLTVELNVEGNPLQPHFMPLIRRARPAQCTLVPDDPRAQTSDHGWNLRRQGRKLAPIIAELKKLGCRVSLFMDPAPRDMPLAATLGAQRVELYTEPYARAFREKRAGKKVIADYARAAQRAQAAGLGVNAGHDLNLANLGPFLRAVPGVLEVSIGHALIADALEMGMDKAVRMYLQVIGEAT